MVGPTRDNIHATVGSMTWNPYQRSNTQADSIFYRQQAESSNAEQWAYFWKDLIEILRFHHSCYVCFPPCFEQKRLRTLPHCQTEIMYRYEGSTCPLRKTPFKRPDSTYFLEVFANYISKFGVLLFLGQKLNRFQPYCFLFLDVL